MGRECRGDRQPDERKNRPLDVDRGGRDPSGRRGAEALDRVVPVELRIQPLIDRVVRRGDQAGAHHAQQQVDQLGRDRIVGEDQRQRCTRQHEDVLEPVIGPGDRHEVGERGPTPGKADALRARFGGGGIGHVVTSAGSSKVRSRPQRHA